MAIKDAFKNLIGIPSDDYYNDNDSDNSATSEPFLENASLQESSSSRRDKDKVVNVHTTTQLAVVLVKPESFEDASAIADHLNEKKTVVLNLESASKEVSRRMIDFLCGAAYANHGKMKRVANNTYIITPYNVDIMGDLLDELENNGVIF